MKKNKIPHPDIDFIGGARQPTEEDFRIISEYIRVLKEKRSEVRKKQRKVKQLA